MCFTPLFALDPDNDAKPFHYLGTGTLVLFQGRPMLDTVKH